MNVKGRIKIIAETQEFDSGFKKRWFVVTTEDEYPQDLKIEFIKDKCGLLDNYTKGDLVEVAVNLRGSEWNGSYFVNLQAWKIDKLGTDSTEIPEAISADAEEGDLPF